MTLQEVELFSMSNQEAIDVSSTVDTRTAPASLQDAAALISKHVNQLLPRIRNELAADDR